MISDEEMALFIREIYLLINDYYKCTDEETKLIIYEEIQFLSKIINT
jgi:hypothetical protein